VAFIPQDYWSVFVDYAESFRAYYKGNTTDAKSQEAQPDDATNLSERQVQESDRVTTQAQAERLVQIAQQHPHRVIAIEGKTVTRTPVPPFITSTLQQAAGSRLRFSPEKAMQVAQLLYEAGLITYMRTDSIALSPEFCTQARQWLQEHDPDNVPKQMTQHRQVKGAQSAHEAIRPTDVYRPSKQLRVELSADELAL
jgi:DNA topoisomerase-1